MLFYAITGLINAITSTILGFFVYLKNRQEKINKTFAMFCLSVAFWSYAYFIWQTSISSESALFWSRALMIGAIFIPVTYFHFVITFLNLYQKKKKLLFFGYILSLIFLILNFTPLFIKNIEPALSFPFWPKPGIAFHPFLLMFFGYVIYSWYLMLQALKKVTGIVRLQIRYIFLGTLIGFVGGSTNYFLWYDIPISPLGNGLVAFYILFTALAILRYHLFEIRVILTEILVGVMGIILLVLPFLMPTGNLRILTLVVFLFFLIFGYYLIKATHEESKRREEAERLVREWERVARVRDQFLLSAQHYFRTPLTSLIGFLEMIVDKTYEAEKLPLALRSAKELGKRIEESLDITQFQLGKAVLEKEEVQLEDLAREVVKELELQAKERGLYLKFISPKESLPKIRIDKRRIKEAISSLIDNALKHTPKGGATVFLEYLKEKGAILFSVKDTGIGIPKEELPYIGSQPFERGEEAKKLSPMGKGIGLYLAKLIVEAHRGGIWAESGGRGKGSTFYIELPI